MGFVVHGSPFRVGTLKARHLPVRGHLKTRASYFARMGFAANVHAVNLPACSPLGEYGALNVELGSWFMARRSVPEH